MYKDYKGSGWALGVLLSICGGIMCLSVVATIVKSVWEMFQ